MPTFCCHSYAFKISTNRARRLYKVRLKITALSRDINVKSLGIYVRELINLHLWSDTSAQVAANEDDGLNLKHSSKTGTLRYWETKYYDVLHLVILSIRVNDLSRAVHQRYCTVIISMRSVHCMKALINAEFVHINKRI